MRPEWIDGNGHLNLAYYTVMFDAATDALWEVLGLGTTFRASGFGTFAVETHTLYRAEMLAGQEATVRSTVVAADGKRLHVAHAMHRDRVVCLQELLYLCVDLETRRVAPWPEEIARCLAAATGPAPDWVGGRIAMPSRA